ncbi:hypothetical protein R3P38DRAFT_3614318 [Favolaschia claudopus]|uniref:Uncharacterized protein n=1 Tax=Favolaschia claudopus TaxID=2862362 RepID=A0AAW0A4Q9_9AGAR
MQNLEDVIERCGQAHGRSPLQSGDHDEVGRFRERKATQAMRHESARCFLSWNGEKVLLHLWFLDDVLLYFGDMVLRGTPPNPNARAAWRSPGLRPNHALFPQEMLLTLVLIVWLDYVKISPNRVVPRWVSLPLDFRVQSFTVQRPEFEDRLRIKGVEVTCMPDGKMETRNKLDVDHSEILSGTIESARAQSRTIGPGREKKKFATCYQQSEYQCSVQQMFH